MDERPCVRRRRRRLPLLTQSQVRLFLGPCSEVSSEFVKLYSAIYRSYGACSRVLHLQPPPAPNSCCHCSESAPSPSLRISSVDTTLTHALLFTHHEAIASIKM